MTRNFRAGRMMFCVLAVAAASSDRSALAADEKPSITVVFPSIDEVFKDLKMAFDLVDDSKGYNTLKETVETFLVGVDTSKAGGIRTYATPTGLQSVLSFPVKNDAEFKKLISNLWDLDVKTAPAPSRRHSRRATAYEWRTRAHDERLPP